MTSTASGKKSIECQLVTLFCKTDTPFLIAKKDQVYTDDGFKGAKMKFRQLI